LRWQPKLTKAKNSKNLSTWLTFSSGSLEDELRHRENPFIIGQYDVDEKYLGKCGDYYTEYDNCIKDTVGEVLYCKNFRKALERCEEMSGMYDDVLKALNIEPKQRLYKKYTNYYS
jgi:hypothetical protein